MALKKTKFDSNQRQLTLLPPATFNDPEGFDSIRYSAMNRNRPSGPCDRPMASSALIPKAVDFNRILAPDSGVAVSPSPSKAFPKLPTFRPFDKDPNMDRALKTINMPSGVSDEKDLIKKATVPLLSANQPALPVDSCFEPGAHALPDQIAPVVQMHPAIKTMPAIPENMVKMKRSHKKPVVSSARKSSPTVLSASQETTISKDHARRKCTGLEIPLNEDGSEPKLVIRDIGAKVSAKDDPGRVQFNVRLPRDLLKRMRNLVHGYDFVVTQVLLERACDELERSRGFEALNASDFMAAGRAARNQHRR